MSDTHVTFVETPSYGLRRVAAHDVVRVVLALILLKAAALKMHQLATEPVADRDVFSYRWVLIAGTEFELCLGIWLISGLWRRESSSSPPA